MQMTLPAYERDRSRWRERILTRALKVATDTAVSYTERDSLEWETVEQLKTHFPNWQG